MPRTAICRCGGVRRNGICDLCSTSKKKTRERGYGSRWQTYSQKFRTQWPLCADCLRKGKAKSIHPGDGSRIGAVDHIIRPPSEHHPLFWDPANHLGRCTPCHSLKTHAEETGRYDPKLDQEFRRNQLSNGHQETIKEQT